MNRLSLGVPTAWTKRLVIVFCPIESVPQNEYTFIIKRSAQLNNLFFQGALGAGEINDFAFEVHDPPVEVYISRLLHQVGDVLHLIYDAHFYLGESHSVTERRD
jgi:hypothetical protein